MTALVPFLVVGIAEDDTIGAGKNIVAGASLNIIKSGGGAASIYSDEAGTTPISLPTTLDSSGQKMIFIAAGAYDVVIGGVSRRHDIIGVHSGALVVDAFSALATTPAAVGQVVFVKVAVTGGTSLRGYIGTSGTYVSDGYSRSPSATASIGWVLDRLNYSATDTFTEDYTAIFDRSTSKNADAIFCTHTVAGAGQGYGIHSVESGSSSVGDAYIFSYGNSGAGGAGGFATSRLTPADAVVANRRDSGDGSGVVGTRWEDGNGNGIMGVKRGSGVGDAVMGYKVLDSEGHAIRGLNESTQGSGVYGWRKNGGGPGSGVAGYAEGSGGGGSLNASIYGFKLSTDNGHAGYFEAINATGSYSVLTTVAFGGTYSASEISSNSTNTSAVTAQVTRGNGLVGVVQKVNVSGFGARTGLLVGSQSFIVPAGASTGASSVIAHDAQVSADITGSSDVRAININNAATGGVDSFGTVAVVTGANTTNYAVYGNATGATTNYSGYFVGNLYYGGSLIPSDSRLKDIHGVADGRKMLSNVLACPVYIYDKYSAWDDQEGNEQRQKIAVNEIGPIAQELQKVTPDHVNSDGKYLAVSDRSELYQLKAAVQHLTKIVMEMNSLLK